MYKYICGLDLSLTGTGVIVLKLNEKNDLVVNELVKSKPSKEKTHLSEIIRLKELVDNIFKIISEKIDLKKDDILFVIEGLSFGMGRTNTLTVLAALNYLVRLNIYNLNHKFIIVAPTSLKKFIAGKGNVKKDVMLLKIFTTYNMQFFDDNLADAFGLAKIGETLIMDDPKDKAQREVINLLNKQK